MKPHPASSSVRDKYVKRRSTHKICMGGTEVAANMITVNVYNCK